MSKGIYTGKDRRRSVRFRFDAVVTVKYDGETFEARGSDFNDDAIGILYKDAIPTGAGVELSVIDELGNRIELTGEVARSDPSDDGEGFVMVVKRV